jgi:hypothetical protein
VREQFYLAATVQNLKRLVRFLSSKPTPQIATAWTWSRETKEATNQQARRDQKGVPWTQIFSTDTPVCDNCPASLAPLPCYFLIALSRREKRLHSWSTSPKQSCGEEQGEDSHDKENRYYQVVAAPIIMRRQHAAFAYVMG